MKLGPEIISGVPKSCGLASRIRVEGLVEKRCRKWGHLIIVRGGERIKLGGNGRINRFTATEMVTFQLFSLIM